MKKGLLTGLLLFGIFFGAGNLIFPPALGVSAGGNFWPAILGFVVSGVGIAIVTLIVGALNPNGYGAEMDEKISLGDVGGNPQAKEEAEKIIKSIKFSEIMKSWGAKPTSGIVFE